MLSSHSSDGINRVRSDAVPPQLQPACSESIIFEVLLRLRWSYFRFMQSTYPHVCTFARAVFTIPVASVLAETQFSTHGYNKNNTRSSLNDSTVANIIHACDVEPAIAHQGRGAMAGERVEIQQGAFAATRPVRASLVLNMNTGHRLAAKYL